MQKNFKRAKMSFASFKKVTFKSLIKVGSLAVLLLAMALMAGCGASRTAAAESVTVAVNGEAVTELTIINGEESPLLTAVISPADYDGEILWESSDAGVVRIYDSEGETCTLSTLKSGTAKVTVTCGNESAAVKIKVVKNQNKLSERETAYLINDSRYSAEFLNLYYADAYASFLSYYGDYALYYGLDSSAGISTLSEQSCDYSSDGTWQGYFQENACSNLLNTVALCSWAEENGLSLSQDGEDAVGQELESLLEYANENGFSDLDAYLSEYYGEGITEEVYASYLRQTALAQEAYSAYSDSLTYTDEELDEHYAEMGYEEGENDYVTVSMRHILVFAEADEEGNYTDEAILAAHEKAEEIYEEWTSGEQTEESFAELVVKYSDDTSSVEDGGLYENIAKEDMVDGIDSWLFSSERKTGDSAVIDNNGSYTGTHVVLFCGTGELYSRYLAKNDLIDTTLSDWLNMLLEAYVCEEGADYKSIGVFA